MPKVVYVVLGSSGFVGSNLRLLLQERADLASYFPPWQDAIVDLSAIVDEHPATTILLIDLAWPNVGASSSTGAASPERTGWASYVDWLGSMLTYIRRHEAIHYIGVGTGIERYADEVPPLLDEPYRTYAMRKRWVSGEASRVLGGRAHWRRMHFLFGPREQQKRFVPSAIRACHTGEYLSLNVPERKRHWLHISDAAAGLLASADPELPQCCDVTGREAISFDALCDLIEKNVGGKLRRRQTGTTADARCLLVEPEHVAPVMPAQTGSVEQLSRRIREYDLWLHSQGKPI
ncbi:MAG: NAD-dependent epimerase/dehydratase family protein [Hyphomicrobium sp.]